MVIISAETMPPVRVRLELPIDRRDAKRRGFDPALGKLILGVSELVSEPIYSIARMVDALRTPGSGGYIRAINEFVPFENVCDHELGNATSLRELRAFKVPDVDSTHSVLLSWDAEAHVIFYTDDETAKSILLGLSSDRERIWQLAKPGYELPFLEQLGVCDPFCFYSKSHMSVEAIGTRGAVVSFLDMVRALEVFE